MWNDTDRPLAIFFTFRTFGTWLHGDERGSVDRNNNVYGSPYIKPSPAWNSRVKASLTREPVILDAPRRRAVEKAIRELCEKRGWRLIALNVRTNHVHCVIAIGETSPDDALIALKANATRHMRRSQCWNQDEGPWVKGGSKLWLWNEDSVWAASDYTNNRQGKSLSDY